MKRVSMTWRLSGALTSDVLKPQMAPGQTQVGCRCWPLNLKQRVGTWVRTKVPALQSRTKRNAYMKFYAGIGNFRPTHYGIPAKDAGCTYRAKPSPPGAFNDNLPLNLMMLMTQLEGYWVVPQRYDAPMRYLPSAQNQLAVARTP